MKTAKRQLNKHDATEETTKRLESIMASFDAFDADMRIGTRQRREKDEFKVFTMCDLGVPSCGGAFTLFKRVVSRRGGRGWFLFRC